MFSLWKQVCNKINDCKIANCEKRLSQICRNYSQTYRCRFKGGFAYLHKKKEDKQEILNQQQKDLTIKHEKDKLILTKEVHMLNALVKNMTLEMVKIS